MGKSWKISYNWWIYVNFDCHIWWTDGTVLMMTDDSFTNCLVNCTPGAVLNSAQRNLGGTYLFSHAKMAMAGSSCVIVLLMLVVVPSDLAVHCVVHLQYPSMIYKLCEIGTKNCLEFCLVSSNSKKLRITLLWLLNMYYIMYIYLYIYIIIIHVHHVRTTIILFIHISFIFQGQWCWDLSPSDFPVSVWDDEAIHYHPKACHYERSFDLLNVI